MTIPDAVRRAALFPHDDLPDPPDEHPYTVVRRNGFVIGCFAGLSFGMVSVTALDPEGVEDTIAEAREILAANGLRRGAWLVAEAASPAGLTERLLSFGMRPYDEAPLEPRLALLALTEPPDPGPPEIEARLPVDLDEFRASARVLDDAVGLNDEDRTALEAHDELLWRLEQAGSPQRTFVALLDGEVVGCGSAVFGARAAYLSGGGTREDVRGRGAYRALVRARWDAAVARGTPVLTVSAGNMSRPILERLGFVNVGWADCLLDQFA